VKEYEKQSIKTSVVRKHSFEEEKNAKQLSTSYRVDTYKQLRSVKDRQDLEVDLLETRRQQADLISYVSGCFENDLICHHLSMYIRIFV
jgi:hypothetical protein